MSLWKKDSDLFEIMKKELFPAVVGDVMDTLGMTHQFLPPQVKPLKDDMILVGRAMPVVEKDIEDGDEELFGLMFDALDSLKENEVYLTQGGSPNYALWGGLMSTRAKKLGAAGCVLNGYHRDTWEIIELGFNVFSWGGYAQDQGVRGKVVDYRCPILYCNGLKVDPGDIVFGDLDGVLVIPKKHEEKIISESLEKVRGEDIVRKAIEKGMSTKEAFRRYGIM